MRKKLGQKGEEIAEKWLADRGYKIVTRNYTLTGGQIDLVMYSPQGNLVFVEVKTRWARHCNQWRPPSSPSSPPPTGHFTKPPLVEHRIGPLQILALRRAANRFLSENPFPFADWQLDLLWITLREGWAVQPTSPAYTQTAVTTARTTGQHTTEPTRPRPARTVVAKIRHYQNVLEV